MNLRQGDIDYLHELLADRSKTLTALGRLIHATDGERAGLAMEQRVIDGVLEALQ